MKKALFVVMAAYLVMQGGVLSIAAGTDVKNGEAEFKEHCALCHPNGGNIINPNKTLTRKDRAANHITSEADIVHLLRNPGPGMTTFDVKTISDEEAKNIAVYIMHTFK